MSFADSRIVFMGTPEFATAPLGALIDEGFNIAAVITAPDKPAGRGRKIQQSAVKQFATAHLICPIYQPVNLKDSEFIEDLKSLDADLFIVVAFRMLPEVVWSMPKYGTFNLHASLLPHYRGAAPINHAIMNGEKLSGVTTFLIDKEIDTGRILFQEEVAIGENDNAGDLHDKLMVKGAGLVVQTVKSLLEGSVTALSQASFNIPEEQLKKAPKIFKEDCIINWNMEASAISFLIRGLSPFPAATATLSGSGEQNIACKIFSGQIHPAEHNLAPGSIKSDNKNYLHVACKNGYFGITSMQLAGKRRMDIEELLRGFHSDIETFSFT